MSLLVVYEDRYCSEIDRALRRIVRRGGALTVPRECYSVEGVTNFRGFVRADWQRFRDQGFPVKGKPRPKALLCIADADAIVDQLGITARARPYQEWIAQAEDELTKLLHEFLHDCTPDPRTVDDDAFTDTFEGSQPCLTALGQRMGWRKLKKGDRRKDDALTWITEHRLDKLVRRVPDLERIAQQVRRIALAL